MQERDYKSLMLDLKSKVDGQLEEFFREKMSSSWDSLTTTVVETIRDFTMGGGKRLRPILMILGHNLFKTEDQRIVKASLSMELTQTYLLIHDDIMDQSELRRGMPSFHIDISKRLQLKGKDSARLGENLAIVAGDLADSYSHQILFESGFGSEQVTSANAELSRIVETTGYGQLLDVYSSIHDSFGQNDLMRLHLWKTAKYTIQGPLVMGAILSGTKNDYSYLSHYGYLLGVAFQLHDDILGLFGEESKTGKSIKSDVNEGKKTLLMIKALEKSSPNDRNFIRECLSSGSVSDTDFERLQELVKSTGSLDYSKSIMQKLVAKSKDYVEKLEGDQNVKDFLNWFADYIISRKN